MNKFERVTGIKFEEFRPSFGLPANSELARGLRASMRAREIADVRGADYKAVQVAQGSFNYQPTNQELPEYMKQGRRLINSALD